MAGLGADDAAGLSVASALLASSSAIMAAAPKEKAAAAGAIETMAYELGAGLGIALFGLILTRSYSASIALPSGGGRHGAAGGVIDWRGGESVPGAARRVAQALMAAAKTAFIQAHSLVLATAGVLLLLLAAGMAQPRHRGENRSRRYSRSDRSIAARRSGARAFSFNAAWR